ERVGSVEQIGEWRPLRIGAVAARGGVDIHDGRIETLGDIGKRRQRRSSRSAARASGGDHACLRRRNSRRRRERAGDHQTEQEPDRCAEAHDRGEKPAGHWVHYRLSADPADPSLEREDGLAPCSSSKARKAVSSSMVTPSCCAFSALLPASCPTMTALVFRLTEPATLPPRRSSTAVACSLVIESSVPVIT